MPVTEYRVCLQRTTLARPTKMRYHSSNLPTGDSALSRARKIQSVVVAVVVALLLGIFAAGWYYSGEIQDGALAVKHEPDTFDLRVTSVVGGRITLETTAETSSKGRWDKDGLWGLATDNTYNQVNRIVETTETSAARDLVAMGPLPIVGDPVRIDSFTFPGDPLQAHGIDFQEVGIPAALGTFPAWLTVGESDTWVILVHGKGANRRESLRILPTLVDQGFTTLSITYRNGEGLPTSPSGYYQYGAEEWEDLEAAATFALAVGAQEIILVGFSMGGGIVASFLYNSSVTSRVNGVIFDSPALNLDASVDHGASQRKVVSLPLPGGLTGVAKFLTTLRFGIDFQAINYVKRADELSTPILLFHGTEDLTVPVWLSDQFADARPDLVEYVRTSGATHVGSWNLDSERYESAVRRFLNGLD